RYSAMTCVAISRSLNAGFLQPGRIAAATKKSGSRIRKKSCRVRFPIFQFQSQLEVRGNIVLAEKGGDAERFEPRPAARFDMAVQKKPICVITVAGVDFLLVIHDIEEIKLLRAQTVSALAGRISDMQIIDGALNGAALEDF